MFCHTQWLHLTILRQLASVDVIFGETEAELLLKWFMTMQNRKDFATVFLPELAGSNLCPGP